ncbi:alpha/beta hydrolase [Sphingopyxis sp. DHUNG17]|uniref:alpha/beta fold hydrolase n=1 Tax=Sphingopyxis jiangsuensis TaxID=2871171 RepID=UPI00191F2414|nr:alpha/beta hydrolase [Sphingopyxis lutea]MBL0768358.1 alpha/beta hydrolase [Sphingopyxis lutea]
MLKWTFAVAFAAASLSTTAATAAAIPQACSAPLFDGTRVTVAISGNGPDVVLLPGLSSPRAVWDRTARRLKDAYRLHIVQIRGFGDSAGANATGPVLDPASREVAGYIDDCILGAGREAPAIVGHSMGGLAGLMIAARQPDAVGKLMIVDALPFIGTLFAPDATVETLRPQAEVAAGAMRAEYGRPQPDGPVADPGEKSPMGRMSNSAEGRIAVATWARASDPRVSAQAFYDVLTTDMRAELGSVTAPVTLVYAQDDRVASPVATKALFETPYRDIANFRAQMISDSRHFLMLDQPAAFAEALDKFLAD